MCKDKENRLAATRNKFLIIIRIKSEYKGFFPQQYRQGLVYIKMYINYNVMKTM